MNNIEKKTLPANGLLNVPSEVSIRGMLGKEISTLFSSLNDAAIDRIIEAVTRPSLDPKELCDEDKLFILHQTRILTFGNEVKQTLKCPYCGNIHAYDVKYDDLNVTYLEEENLNDVLKLENDISIEKKISLQSDLEESMRYKDKMHLTDDYTFILSIASKIKRVNGKKKSLAELVSFLENLPGRELVKVSEFVKTDFGINTTFKVECTNCKNTFTGGIGINADLFR